MYAKMAKWFERGRLLLFFLLIFFLSKLDIVKVINCFFFLKSLTFQKISNHVYKNISLRNIALRVSSQRDKVQITSVLAFILLL